LDSVAELARDLGVELQFQYLIWLNQERITPHETFLRDRLGFDNKIINKKLSCFSRIFTPKFIRRLLNDCGFTNVVVYNASLSGNSLVKSFPVFSFVTRLIEVVEKLTDLIFGGRVLWGPPLEVIARKK